MLFVGFLVILATCLGNVSAQQGTYCGETPSAIYPCLKNPKIIDHDVAGSCDDSTYSDCERMTCIFRESNWLTKGKVDKKKLSAHYDQYAKDHPEWSAAVQHLKTDCINQELRPQGTVLNCPAYDIIHCITTSFIRNAAPTQWSPSKTCEYPKAYAASCPVCPSSCYATAIPYGSCNACLSVPRSP